MNSKSLSSKKKDDVLSASSVPEIEWIKIDPNININELISAYPELAEVLTYDYGLHCINCIISDLDTLENGAAIHGIEGKEFEEMIEHLEKIINGEEDVD